jgi:hypothetical protein
MPKRKQDGPVASDGGFAIKDCALAAIATGRHAQNLKELRDEIETIDPACLLYHFWAGLLRPIFDDPRFNNGFARWVFQSLHNQPLAERLSVIDPTDFDTPDGLRRELVDVIEEELDRSEVLPWTSREQQFFFIRSQIVVFSTNRTIHDPSELPDAVATMTASSIFYHFIDARRRTPNGVDDFSTWLTDLQDVKYAQLCTRLAGVDPYFKTLLEIREELLEVFNEYLPA